jgi:outer membrane biosynthesis protein TonB
MTASGIRRRQSLTPALLAAAVLHIAVFAALVFLARTNQPFSVGASVPINIVANAPTTDTRAAEAAPAPEEVQSETPLPEAPPAPPAPSPKRAAPRPTPPVPVPPAPSPEPKAAPAPSPKPAKTKPAAAQANTPPAKSAFNLDALQASISKAASANLSKSAGGKKGPTQRETALQARPDVGPGVSANDVAGLSQLLQRLWNTNCDADGGDTVVVPVRFTLDSDGRVVGGVTAGGQETSSDPVVFAAARRAIDAVHAAAPYAQVYRGKAFKVIFDAKKACSQR